MHTTLREHNLTVYIYLCIAMWKLFRLLLRISDLSVNLIVSLRAINI